MMLSAGGAARGDEAIGTQAASAPSSAPAPRPHIVFLLADDLGWGDVGYHGSEIRTPAIDRLAQRGVRMNQFYVLQSCTPTRAALLTGRHPMRFGLQAGIVWRDSDYGLPPEERTLAEALRDAGYETAIVGKWHLGHATRAMRPMAQGVAHQYGGLLASSGYFDRKRGGASDWYRDEQPLQEDGYTTDLLAAEAERIITEHDPQRPLFLYVPFTAPHLPLEAPREYLKRYRRIRDRDRRTYAAMVTCLDDAIERILRALTRRGMERDTLVIFCSDNGAAGDSGGSNKPLRGGKRDLYDGALRVPAAAWWPGVLEGGRVIDEPLHVTDWYPTLVRLAGGSLAQPRPIDGLDIWPTLTTGAPSPHEDLLLNFFPPGIGAIRRGPWKLLVRDSDDPPLTELFQLSDDPAECQNLAEAHPD
ncbi:MAG: arylsulfatase, partial [Planctomycetota bacterium]